MEGAPPSSGEDDVNFTLNQLKLDTLMSELPWLPPEEVPVNQSCMLCNDQAGQNMLVDNNDSIQQTTQFPTSFPQTMTAMGGLDGTSSSWINQNGPNWPQTPSSSQQFPYQFNQVPITPNQYDPQSSTMLLESSQTLRFPQFPPHNHQVSGDYNVLHSYCSDSMLFEPTSSSRHQNSFIQPGHVYMTQNATTSQHGGFNQPTPRIQCIPNQGQVDQASVIPNIDNTQQENLVPRNSGKSTRSQMDNLQVQGLQNQTTRPNSSLQSQNRGLNTQQMEGALRSSVEDDVNFTLNQLELDTLMSELSSLPLEEVPVNQSSMLCNDQAGENMLVDSNDSIQQTTQFPTSSPQTMTTVGGLDGTSSSWINQNGPNWPQTPSSDHQWTNQLSMSNQVAGMLLQPQPPMNQWSLEFPPHNIQVSGDHDLFNSNCYDSTIFEPTSSSRIQCIPNQGQVDQASVIPNIDNMQQENLVPRNSGKSTRSQMENPQVHVLQNHIARLNASNPGPDSSLQSQNTQQVQRAGLRDPFWNYVEEKDDNSMICKFCQRRWETKIPISRIKWHLSGEEGHGVAICPSVNKEVQEGALKAMRSGNKRHKSTTSSINVNDRGISTCPQEQNIENENMGAENAMENSGERSCGHDAFQTIPRTEQVHNAQNMIRVRTGLAEEVVFKKSGRSAVLEIKNIGMNLTHFIQMKLAYL